jgi:multiple sugar transport system permease protein
MAEAQVSRLRSWPRSQASVVKHYRRFAHKTLVYVLLVGLGALYLLPFLWALSTSLKPTYLLFRFPPVWIPNSPHWSNYADALDYIPFLQYLQNTLTIAVPATIGAVASSALVGYSFSRIDWPGRNVLFIVLLSTMMIPYQVTMVPLFILFSWLHWVNTFKPLIIPAFFGVPFYIFLLRQFFMTIPRELSDAGRVDGCTEFGIFRRIVLPLSRPALTTVALFSFIGNWNDFLGPLIYLSDDTKYTLAVGLRNFQQQSGSEWALLMAASIVMMTPIIVLFFFAQKTFIQSITLTGIKG